MNTPCAPVDRNRAENICKTGQGAACCKWLAMGDEGYICIKHDPVWRNSVIEREDEMGAKGDNCEGLCPQ